MLKIGNVIIDEKEIMYITTTTFRGFKPEINVVFKDKEMDKLNIPFETNEERDNEFEKLVKKLVGGKYGINRLIK